MRVEAESTSSHGAAIVAFEASGLARVFLPKRLRSTALRSVLFAVQVPLRLVLHPELRCRNPQVTLCVCFVVSIQRKEGSLALEPRRSSPLRAPRRSPSTAISIHTPCPLRRSLLAFGIERGHARHTNARARRSQVDGAARNSQRHVSVASQRRVGRRTAVGRSGSCATRRGTGRDPGPCSPMHGGCQPRS